MPWMPQFHLNLTLFLSSLNFETKFEASRLLVMHRVVLSKQITGTGSEPVQFWFWGLRTGSKIGTNSGNCAISGITPMAQGSHNSWQPLDRISEWAETSTHIATFRRVPRWGAGWRTGRRRPSCRTRRCPPGRPRARRRSSSALGVRSAPEIFKI